MNDFYREILVKRRPGTTDLVLKIGMIALTVVAAAAGILLIPLMLLAAVILGAVSWFVISGRDIEYEYLYVNGDFDVDRIANKQRRKRVGSYSLEEMELIAPSQSHELDSWQSGSAKIIDYTSQEPGVKSYTGVYRMDGETVLVRYELDKEILQDMRRLAPRKVSRECF